MALAAGILLIALLYSSVGHAGASGYIAVMSLFGLSPAAIKPTALSLNILVASIGSYRFWRAGHFSWRLFWPFAVLSLPMAFVGGWLTLPAHLFKLFLGAILLYSAARFLFEGAAVDESSRPPLWAALGSGAVIGLASGITGTGGGIFLTPLLLTMRWAKTKQAAAASAVFILVNSVAGLAGNLSSTKDFPAFALLLAGAAAAGGAVGSHYGSVRFDARLIKRLLSAVLLIAALKFLLN